MIEYAPPSADDAGMLRLWAALVRGLRPDPPLSVSAWADAHRVLDPSTSAEPGPWRTSRTPYLREPMDALGADDPCQVVVIKAGSQVGKSEAGLNWLGWIAANSPGPTLMVQPTVEDGENFSKTRVAPMIEASPSLRERIATSARRDSGNTVMHKDFAGGFLKIVGANAPSKLASTPIRRLFLDEVDRFPADAGGEGDPVQLAYQRTSTFSNRKILLTSTPTTEGVSRIEAAWLESDQRQYLVACPHCDERQRLQWTPTPDHPGGLVWTRGMPETAAYQCAACGVLIDESAKPAMLAGGIWTPTAPSDGRTRGYMLSSLYSPLGWVSWADLVREWEAATGDPERLKVFVNSRLAEVWKLGESSSIETGTLRARSERYTAPVPAGVQILTAGVDVQDDRIEVEVVGWGAGEESWSIAWLVLPGDPSGAQVWADLDAALRKPWPTSTGEALAIAAACIDTGGHNTMAVYAFCRGKEGRRIWPVKGRGGAVPAWPRRPTRSNRGRVALYIVGVDAVKEQVYGRLRISAQGPGYMHFPDRYPRAYYEQLTAERMQTTRWRGRVKRTWILPPGKRNEVLDCRVYATAALHGLSALGLRLARMVVQPATPTPEKQALAPAAVASHTVAAPIAAVPVAPAVPAPKAKRKSSHWGGESIWR